MRRTNRYRTIVLFLTPALIVYGLFFFYPAMRALYVSLFEWSGFVPKMEFVGLANFKELARDTIFWKALKNTMVYLVAGGAFTLSIALLFAALVSKSTFWGRKLLRAIIFFPIVVPAVGLGIIGTFFFNPAGILNDVLRTLGLDMLTRTWLGPDLAIYSMLAAIVWATAGFSMVVFAAGIEKIPPTYAEAARVEGANEIQIFFRITLPMIWDVVTITVVFWIIGALKMFELIYTLTLGGPNWSTSTISIFTYVMAFGQRETIYRMGYGTAAGVVLLFLVIAGSGLTMFLMRREAIEY
jgi:ABC-type sugar transport system permease subunit